MRSSAVFSSLALAVSLVACSNADDAPYTDHETTEDFVVEKTAVRGLPASFDREHVMDDDFFLDDGAIGEAEVQAFLEDTPYGNRCFLASERVNGQSAAAAIVAGAREHGINPIVLLARMQVERSLIGKTSRPSAHSVDYAFGCGCPDNQACNSDYRGLGKQVACAARTLRRHFDGSIAGTSPWVAGRSGRTLDPTRLTPDNHATASLYSYTPWVLPNRGGNWLVWNITKKFAGAFEAAGAVSPAPESPPAESPPAAPGTSTLRAEWIGDACIDDTSCRFADGTSGVCQRLPMAKTGMCTVSCEGLCPDLAGHGSTFCVSASVFGGDEGGLCTRKSASDNDFCGATAGLRAATASRFVGDSNASARSAEVCVPQP